MRVIPVIVMLALAGCTLVPDARSRVVVTDEPRVLKAEDVPERFAFAVRRMRPVVIETCKSTSPNLNCDFLIAIDPNPNSAPNAFQTVSCGSPSSGGQASLTPISCPFKDTWKHSLWAN